MKIFGSDVAEAFRRVGDREQLVWADYAVEQEGSGAGTRRIRVGNGSGLELELLPDRCLDIGRAVAWGRPIAWHSGVGFGRGTPGSAGEAWLDSFGGGFLSTCGLDNFGRPGDDGEAFGLHGDVGSRPVRISAVEATEAGVVVVGEVAQGRALGDRVRLRRRIEMPIGDPRLIVTDTVTNESPREVPVMVLYHWNVGWPVLAEDTVVRVDSETVEARDADAAVALQDWSRWSAPEPGIVEQVFLHRMPPAARAAASVTTPSAGLRLTFSWDSSSLPFLFQWKLPAEHDYVLGIEPANCATLDGRAVARERGILPTIEPGGVRQYRVDVRAEHLVSKAGEAP